MKTTETRNNFNCRTGDEKQNNWKTKLWILYVQWNVLYRLIFQLSFNLSNDMSTETTEKWYISYSTREKCWSGMNNDLMSFNSTLIQHQSISRRLFISISTASEGKRALCSMKSNVSCSVAHMFFIDETLPLLILLFLCCCSTWMSVEHSSSSHIRSQKTPRIFLRSLFRSYYVFIESFRFNPFAFQCFIPVWVWHANVDLTISKNVCVFAYLLSRTAFTLPMETKIMLSLGCGIT